MGVVEAATRAGASTGAGRAAGAGAAGAGVAVDGAAAAGAEVVGADGADGAAEAVFSGVAFSAPARSSAGNVSLMFRTTGGSMVDDADRTNSPFSFR